MSTMSRRNGTGMEHHPNLHQMSLRRLLPDSASSCLGHTSGSAEIKSSFDYCAIMILELK